MEVIKKIYKNKMRDVIDAKGVSISYITNQVGRMYGNVHRMINSDTIDDKKFSSVVDVAMALDVPISDLYEIEYDCEFSIDRLFENSESILNNTKSCEEALSVIDKDVTLNWVCFKDKNPIKLEYKINLVSEDKIMLFKKIIYFWDDILEKYILEEEYKYREHSVKAMDSHNDEVFILTDSGEHLKLRLDYNKSNGYIFIVKDETNIPSDLHLRYEIGVPFVIKNQNREILKTNSFSTTKIYDLAPSITLIKI